MAVALALNRGAPLFNRMRKAILILPVLLLLLAPQACAWRRITHEAIAEAAYQELPENLKDLLDRDKIIEGSTWPDRYRHDPDPYGRTFPDHFPRASITQAESWLEMAKNSYLDKDYGNAGLHLGIACHYIADSTCLAHNPPYAYDWDKHGEFEQQGVGLSPAVPTSIAGFNLRQKLTGFYNAAPTVWQRWLSTRDQEIAQEGVDLAASYTYNAWCQALNVPPREAQGITLIDFRVIAGIALVALVVVIVIGMRRFYRE